MAGVAYFITVVNVAVLAFLLRSYNLNSVDDGDLLVEKVNDSYDYIVVGSGSAGSVIAARLSEDRDVTVLVLEAGIDDRNEAVLYTPSQATFAERTKFDWEYYTEPQKHACWALKEKKSYWPRGRVLGGSSQLNYMAYVRGNKFDYDGWAAQGCTGWSYKDVLPYFKKSEDMLDEELAKSEYHGTAGPLRVSRNPTSVLPSVFLLAAKEAGYNETDPNGACQEGFTVEQSTLGDGVRSSTSKSFLWPARTSRNNLQIATQAHVRKVIIKNKKAVAVEFVKNDRLHRVKAKREIILSAGAIGSAQILMLSGIGPKKHLQELKIPVVADLPVGDNLQDHALALLRVLIDQPLTTGETELSNPWTKLQYDLFKAGYLTTPSGNELTGFVRTRQDLQYGNPDLQFQMVVDLPTRKRFGLLFDTKVNDELGWGEGQGFALSSIALRPKSVGTVRLRNTDPFEHPLIQPNYLSAKEDMMVMYKGIRIFQKLLKSKAFRAIGARLDTTRVPTCRQYTYDSDEYWQCYVRSITLTAFDQVGTCKMGGPKDPTSVVDPQLRVKGISGLRVADASIMPKIISGNTNAPTIMIGEKAADLIKGKNFV